MEHPSLPVNRNPRAKALKHGLGATDELLLEHLSPEERQPFDRLRALFYQYYDPKSEIERLIIDKITIQNFRLFRIYRLEYSATQNSTESPLSPESVIHHLDRLSRYDSRIAKQLQSLRDAFQFARRERQYSSPNPDAPNN
ncbi:hypothetical protein IT157_02820 [bacterium]|nr:hypothetical protein [bacterium]